MIVNKLQSNWRIGKDWCFLAMAKKAGRPTWKETNIVPDSTGLDDTGHIHTKITYLYNCHVMQGFIIIRVDIGSRGSTRSGPSTHICPPPLRASMHHHQAQHMLCAIQGPVVQIIIDLQNICRPGQGHWQTTTCQNGPASLLC